MNPFIRLEQLIGSDSLERLKNARVAVFGLGAVGSYAVEALARAGIGYLRLIDYDDIKPSNCNRQLYALHSTIHQAKIDVARARVLDINPACIVECHRTFVDNESVDALLASGLDMAIDAIDGLLSKIVLLTHAVNKGVPIMSSMGAGGKRNPALIKTGDISETIVCPLARYVRKRLRRQGIVSGIRCVYSTEVSNIGTPLETDEDTTQTRGRLRTPIGSISYITGMFGLLIASEVINALLDQNGRLYKELDNKI